MSETVLRDHRLWLGSRALQATANAVALSIESEELDRTTLADAGRRRLGGLTDDTLGVDGFFDAAVDADLFGKLGLSDEIIGVTAPDAAEGVIAYALKCFAGELNPVGGDVGTIGAFTLGASGDGPIVRGKLDVLRSAVTAAGNGAGVELGSSDGKTLYAAVFVTSIAAGTTLSITIESEEDSGFATPVSRITVPAITAAGAVWATDTGGSGSDDWFRANFTLSGASPSADFAVILGVK